MLSQHITPDEAIINLFLENCYTSSYDNAELGL